MGVGASESRGVSAEGSSWIFGGRVEALQTYNPEPLNPKALNPKP